MSIVSAVFTKSTLSAPMHKKAAPAWHRCGTFFEKAGSPIILHCFHKIPLCGSQIEYIDDIIAV